MRCQKCHAPLVEGYPDRFRCGSYITQSGHFQEAGVSGTCIARQRDNLEVRVEELREAVDAVASIADRIEAAIPEYKHEMSIVRKAKGTK